MLLVATLLALAAAAEPARPAWAASLAIGDCAPVAEALAGSNAPAQPGPVERLAAARCLRKLGQSGRALEVLDGGDAPPADLAPYFAIVRAEALLDRDRPADAVKALDGVDVPGTDDDLLRGRALVSAGRGLDARDGLRKLLDGPDGDEARAWLAIGAEARGDQPAAITTWRAIWTRSPTSTWSARAEDHLRSLGSPVPTFTTQEGRDLVMLRVKRLLELHQAAPAVDLLDGIAHEAPFTTREALLFHAGALFDAHLYVRAVEQYAKAGADDVDAKTAFSYALATARSGDYALAAQRYAALAKKWPDRPEADEALWKIPYMAYDAGRFAEASAGFTAYLKARPDGKFAPDARWFRAWGAWRSGDTATAIAGFEEVIRLHGDTDIAAAARYWHARAKDDPNELRDVLRRHPSTSYAYFAAEKLGVRYPAQADVTPPAFPDAFLAARPSLATAMTLLRAGMADWARPLLAQHVDAAKAAGRDTALAMAWALLDAEDFPRAKALASPWCGTSAVASQVCTPRPHAQAVEALAKDRGLPVLLPYAIMNAESGLDPLVTSPAGARGLMQLMPALAAGLAQDQIPGFAVDDLYLAGVNARLGTLELGLLQARYARSTMKSTLPLVIAGYNGGADAVDRWLATYTTAPEPDRFAEDISFTETRRYVRRVLGFLMDYRRVYGDR